MNFSSSDRIASVISNLKDVEELRANNRKLINQLMNGYPPYTPQEVRENHIQWNVNWGEGSDLLLQGREQLENAHLSTDYFFTVRIPDAPKSKRSQYEQTCSKLVNRLMKGSLPYLHTQRQAVSSVILHGPGSQMWFDADSWRSAFVAIDDLLVPTDTELPYDNLNHFAAKRRMSRGQLWRKTFGMPEDKRDPGWDMKAVGKVLDTYRDVNSNPNSYDFASNPERASELYKQNASYYDSDAVPVIWMWDFFYQEDEDEQARWYRKILLDSDCVASRNSGEAVSCIYDSGKPFADKLSHILHTEFIDGNNVPPFMYHSVRGLGQRLFDIIHALNRVRNQTVQKLMEDMLLLFRADDPVDRSRLNEIYLGINHAIFPSGLSFVTRDQRYQIDPNFLEMVTAQLKQLAGEGSQQYTQDIDTGTKKERTAFEVNAILHQTTRLTGSMLNLSYMQRQFLYEETCRRLTRKNTLDFDAKLLQNSLKEAGVPEKWIDSAKWEIEPVRVLGSGNAQLEQAQAQALYNIRFDLNPEAQQKVLHSYVYSFTHNPALANELAPLDAAPKITDTVADTERVYGAIMAGSVVTPKPGLIAGEVVPTMLRLMGNTVQQVMAMGGVGTPEKINGLQQAMAYTGAFIDQLAQDKANNEMVKQFSDALGQIANVVRGMAQRLQEQMQKRQANGLNPEIIQKLMANQAMTQQKMQTTGEKHQQKMAQNQEKFMLDQQRRNAQTMSDIYNAGMETTMNPPQQPAKPEGGE